MIILLGHSSKHKRNLSFRYKEYKIVRHTFRTLEGFRSSGKLFLIKLERRSTTALQRLMYSVSGSTSVWTKLFNLSGVIVLRWLFEADELIGDGL